MAYCLVSFELCEKRGWGGKRVVLFKRVGWGAVPRQDEPVFAGADEEGERSGFSAPVRQVYWEANSEISVCCIKENLLDEFDQIVENMKRDGFTEEVPPL